MTLVLAASLGLLVGGMLGGLGGGGAIVTVPAMVYLLDQSPRAATTGSLVVVGLSALAGVVSHRRSGQVRWRLAAELAMFGAPGAWAGAQLNRGVDEDLLMVAFSALMLLAAGALVADRADVGARGTTTSRAASPTVLVLAAVLVGMVTGFFGVGGGFVVVPVLVLVGGLPMPTAVGTSLVVVALNTATSLAVRIDGPPVDLGVVLPFALAAMTAAMLGRHVAERLPAHRLTAAFAAVLVLVAIGTAAQALHDGLHRRDPPAGQASSSP